MLQSYVRAAGGLWICLMVSLTFANDPSPVPTTANGEPVGGFSPIPGIVPQTYDPVTNEPVVVNAPSVVSEPAIVNGPAPTCMAPNIYNCGDPAYVCNTDCRHGHYGSHCPKPRCYCHFHSTGDMYPHYAYFPEHHGYYYFRPYNYTNVFKHRQQALQLGVSPSNPYSISMLNPLFEQFALTHLAPVDDYEKLPPSRKSLPILEDVLYRN